MAESNIKLLDYIKKNLVIPAYQRGYVWGKKDKNREKDSVTFLLEDLIQSYNEKKQNKFLQAVTVYEDNNDINVVDGQQRTVFFYLLLTYLENKNQSFRLKYKIRENSNAFLQEKCTEFIVSLENGFSLNESDEQFKDIYFFKKTLEIFYKNEPLKSIDNKDDFKTYILNNIYFLYLPIKKEHVKTTFTMMNGNKAIMRSDELIKAELLRLISIDESNVIVNRARVAKEWERWIQWWNREDVKSIFHIKDKKSNDKLKELIKLMYANDNISTCKEIYNLNGKDLFLFIKHKYLKYKNNAIDTFNKLRLKQKQFEDIYNNPVAYNKAGFIITAYGKNYNILLYILNIYKNNGSNNNENKLALSDTLNNDIDDENTVFNKLYYITALHGLKWKTITNYLDNKINNTNKEYVSVFNEYRNKLINASFKQDAEFIRLILLLRNIEEDIALKRKFTFDIINEHSIEHIYPQNPEHNDNNIINDNNIHSIGNLVLLYKNENSSLSNKDFYTKKRMFFNYNNDTWFKRSIHLLDTVKEFSKDKWGQYEIYERNKSILGFFDKKYKQFSDFMYEEE